MALGFTPSDAARRAAKVMNSRDEQLSNASKHHADRHNIRSAIRLIIGAWEDWEPPINLAPLLSEYNLKHVRRKGLSDKGQVVSEAGRLLIETELELSEEESTFVLAHELGHIALGRLKIIPFPLAGEKRIGKYAEGLCTQFSRELLLPQDWLVARLADYPQWENDVQQYSTECRLPVEHVVLRIADACTRLLTVTKWRRTRGKEVAQWVYANGKYAFDDHVLAARGAYMQQGSGRHGDAGNTSAFTIDLPNEPSFLSVEYGDKLLPS